MVRRAHDQPGIDPTSTKSQRFDGIGADADDVETLLTFESALSAARSGDGAALSWLWKRHQPALLGWLRTTNSANAEDIASDAWIEALRIIKEFVGDEKGFRSLLFTVARRRSIDLYRREVRGQGLLIEAAIDRTSKDVETESVETLAAKAAIERIRQVLPPDQAEIVLLRVVGELDAEQVATVVGRKAGTVRVVQHRALKLLAQVYEPSERRVSQSESEGV